MHVSIAHVNLVLVADKLSLLHPVSSLSVNPIFCGLPFWNYPVDIKCVLPAFISTACAACSTDLLYFFFFRFLSKIQGEIVDVFMTFTRPIIQSADHEEGIRLIIPEK